MLNLIKAAIENAGLEVVLFRSRNGKVARIDGMGNMGESVFVLNFISASFGNNYGAKALTHEVFAICQSHGRKMAEPKFSC